MDFNPLDIDESEIYTKKKKPQLNLPEIVKFVDKEFDLDAENKFALGETINREFIDNQFNIHNIIYKHIIEEIVQDIDSGQNSTPYE